MFLAPTPPDRLCDGDGRPYFLWDNDLSLEAWRALVDDVDPTVRLYWIGAALRQAKPDDAIVLLGRPVINWAVPQLVGRLGKQEGFWNWLVAKWPLLE